MPTKDLITTREVAALLGVGTTSIKRWADSGLLECIRTPGGHRRFTRSSVARLMAATNQVSPTNGDPIGAWVDLLCGNQELDEVVVRLDTERRRRLDAWELAEFLGEVLQEIGRRWNVGELTVLEEHLASERFARAMAMTATSLEIPATAPVALLLVAEGEHHTLGLSLVELCLREAGWTSRWPGVDTPFAPVREFVNSGAVDCVAISASVNSSNSADLGEQAQRYGDLCRLNKIPLLLGGRGAWPENPAYGRRLHQLSELRDLLESGGMYVG